MSTATARPERARVTLLAAVLLGLAVLAWVALLAWEASSLAHVMHLPPLVGPDFVCERPSALAQGSLYVGGWVLMTVAMMLPTTVPLVQVFARLVGRRGDGMRLFALLVAGYLVVWTAFGFAALLIHGVLRRWAEGNGWLWAHAWVPGATTLALAGAFQFSSLKASCLDACRSPLPFVVSRWHGRSPARDAFRLGVDHGAYCVGCCWALMLLMLTVGLGSVAWMLLLGAVMALEKNAPWGKRLSAPLGLALLGLAIATAFGVVPAATAAGVGHG